jgi:hypothetical protein
MRLPLAAGERVIVKSRAHRRVLAGPAVVFLLLVAATAFTLGWLSREDLPGPVEQALPLLHVLVPIVAGVLLLAWCVAPLVRWLRTWTYLTNRRVVVRSGTRSSRQWELALGLVRRLHVKQGFLRRGGGSGDLVLDTGDGQALLADMPAVHRLRELVADAMQTLPRTGGFDGVEIEGEQRMDWTEHG